MDFSWDEMYVVLLKQWYYDMYFLALRFESSNNDINVLN
jgi:hypothetical protein